MIHIVKRNFFSWLAIAFLQLVIATPAFAQMVGVGSYTDAWGDGDYVYGAGTTDSPYNNYNHTFRAATTLVSPLGRSSSSDTGYSSYAVSFVSLSFEENDVGFYTIDTDHYDFCPIVSQEVYSNHTGAAVKVGITNVCYQWDPAMSVGNHCEYIRQADCPVTKCKDPLFHTYTKQSSEPLCPAMFRAKRKWVEKQDGCGCNITCTTVETVQYQVPCFCTEFGIAQLKQPYNIKLPASVPSSE